MENNFCGVCNSVTNIVIDHQTCETTCSLCGSLISLSQNAENPTNQNSENQNLSDSNSDTHLRTATAAAAVAALISRGRRLNNNPLIREPDHSRRKRNPSRGLKHCYGFIDQMSAKLSINDCEELINNRAKDIATSVDQAKITCIGGKSDAVAAACLFWACREIKLSCSFKEIYRVANCRKTLINLMIRKIKDNFQDSLLTAQTSELLSRFCARLGMTETDVMAVQDAMELSEKVELRKKSETILGGIVYLITQISNDKKSLQDIASAFEITEQTIEEVYRDLRPHISKLIPQWFATEKDYEKIQDL